MHGARGRGGDKHAYCQRPSGLCLRESLTLDSACHLSRDWQIQSASPALLLFVFDLGSTGGKLFWEPEGQENCQVTDSWLPCLPEADTAGKRPSYVAAAMVPINYNPSAPVLMAGSPPCNCCGASSCFKVGPSRRQLSDVPLRGTMRPQWLPVCFSVCQWPWSKQSALWHALVMLSHALWHTLQSLHAMLLHDL